MTTPTQERQFKQFWKIYPRRVATGAAQKSFERVLKIVSFNELMDAVKVYADSVKGKQKEFIPHATTWLNQKRWLDEVEQEPSMNDYFNRLENENTRIC